jgi:hydroxyacylglutathione hydrolase
MIAATGAELLAHAAAARQIGGVTQPKQDGDLVRVGSSVTLRCLDTPGHTRAHLCLYADANGQAPALFSGDTLFNAGVGNCVHGGDPQALYETFARRLEPLPDATRVFPGHEYLQRNLAFTLDREPSNAAARALAERTAALAPEAMPVLTLGDERAVNAFLRLGSEEIIERLAQRQALPARATAREVFLTLRELRNRW